MAGSQQLQSQTKDYDDPFNAGQLVGMLVILEFIEINGGINQYIIEEIKKISAENLEGYFGKPTEDIHLMIQNMVKDIDNL